MGCIVGGIIILYHLVRMVMDEGMSLGAASLLRSYLVFGLI